MNDNHDLDTGIEAIPRDTTPLADAPLRIAVIGGAIIVETTANPSMTAGAAERTGVALIAAANELRRRTLTRLRSRSAQSPQH